MLKKGDIILLAIVATITIAGLLYYNFGRSTEGDVIAVIKQNDSIVKKINLNKIQEPEEIKIDGLYHISIKTEKNRIRFEDADCPDLVCVKTGWLSKKGDMAVCIPGHIIIKIEGASEKVDGVAY